MEVSDQIIKVLDEIGKRFGLAIDWTQSNIVPYVQQLGQKIVNYELWTSVVWIVLSLILLIISLIFFKKSMKGYKDNDGSEEWFVACLMCIIGIIFPIIVIVVQTFDIVTCLTLPEKVIMEFVKQYIH